MQGDLDVDRLIAVLQTVWEIHRPLSLCRGTSARRVWQVIAREDNRADAAVPLALEAAAVELRNDILRFPIVRRARLSCVISLDYLAEL